MTTLAKVLAAHQWYIPSRGDQGGCLCCWRDGITMTRQEFTAHQVETVADAGLAVIQLPEPPWKYALGAGDTEDIYCRDGLVAISGIDTISPEYARELATALLAAANAAEALNV